MMIKVFFLSLFYYFLILGLYRMMGKREVGEVKVVDLVVAMLLSNMASNAISEDGFFKGLIPILLISFLQIVLSRITLKYEVVRKFIDGEPSVIINRGKINFKEMLAERYNIEDLLMELRNQGIRSIEEVDYAILEVSGRLSVFLKSEGDSYPLPLIVDGKVSEDVLYQLGKNKNWLNDVLRDEGVREEDVFYAFYKENEIFFIKNKNN